MRVKALSVVSMPAPASPAKAADGKRLHALAIERHRPKCPGGSSACSSPTPLTELGAAAIRHETDPAEDEIGVEIAECARKLAQDPCRPGR